MDWGYFMGSWNYVASSGSSTTEGASDVSPSHLFQLSPGTWRLCGLCLGVCGWFVCWVGFCSLFSCFAICKCFFFPSNAALLKTVAVMFLQTLSQKEADNYSSEKKDQSKKAPTKATHTTHKTRERLWQT